MAMLLSERKDEPINAIRRDTETLRQWSCPKVILVVTDGLDEESLEFHALLQARQSQAKVLLVQVTGESGSVSRTRHMRGSEFKAYGKLECAERICLHLRSSGIACDPVVVHGLNATEIPAIARSCCADRVLVSAPAPTLTDTNELSTAEQIIDGLEIPVCIVGRDMSTVSRFQRPSRRITLVLSATDCKQVPIGFSCRLAEELHSQLTIMHVIPDGIRRGRRNEDDLAEFTSHLPSEILEEARQLCPVDISVKRGDPIAEVLEHDIKFKQDFLVLAPQSTPSMRDFGMSEVRKIIRQARCPVIILTAPRGSDS